MRTKPLILLICIAIALAGAGGCKSVVPIKTTPEIKSLKEFMVFAEPILVQIQDRCKKNPKFRTLADAQLKKYVNHHYQQASVTARMSEDKDGMLVRLNYLDKSVHNDMSPKEVEYDVPAGQERPFSYKSDISTTIPHVSVFVHFYTVAVKYDNTTLKELETIVNDVLMENGISNNEPRLTNNPK